MLLLKLISRIWLVAALLTAGVAVGAPLLRAAAPVNELAYISGTSDDPDIFLYDAAYALSANLTQGDAKGNAVSWSPDGNQLAFTTYHNRVVDIDLMNADGGNVRNLTAGKVPHLYPFWPPAWSPNGSHLAFVSFRDNLRYQLHIIRADGSNLINISADLGPIELSPPVWSPDSQQVLFATYISLNSQMYLADAESGETQQVSGAIPAAFAPAWSPDGRQIAFRAPFNGPAVYVLNTTTDELRSLSQNSNGDLEVRWSPDGREVSFARDNADDSSEAADLYISSVGCPDSTNQCSPDQRNLTHSPDESDHIPTWSPDGRQIAFASWEGNARSAYVYSIDLENGNLRRLLYLINQGRAADFASLIWSPDGRFLTVIARWSKRWEIDVVDTISGRSNRFATQANLVAQAAWRP